ncbi:MAG: MFS transporter [Scytonema hyalinum WJT4-NPBG1]|nr:MFS transporter [Scytonema hyalinum WJT4-NPBG1]
MAPTMFRPLLVDIGLSLSDIGWLLGIVGTIANMLGGIVAGLLIAPLGRKRSLIVFSSVWALTMMTYLLPAFGVTNLLVLYLVACAAFLTIGMMTTATFTIMMDKSTLETPGTDYTVQSSVGTMGSIGAAAISSVVAGAIGYRGVFAVSGAIAIISVLIIVKLFRSTERAVTSRDA